jgi:DNA-binding MarR family transcriptional regulator
MVNEDGPPGSTVLLTRLSKLVYRTSSEERLGMTLRHFVTLSYLRDHPRTPQHQLDDVFCIGANNLVLLLNELEAAGLVERRRDATDRRRHLVLLTPSGETALEHAERAQRATEDELFAALGPAERAQLHELLSRALAGAEAPAAAALAAST